MAENSGENITLRKNNYTYGNTIRRLMSQGKSEEKSRNEVAKAIRKMRRNPIQRTILHEQRTKMSELKNKILIDELTGLYNVRAFKSIFPRVFDHARRSGEPLTLLMIDVDYFKEYNDRFGHPAGDDVLRKLAQIMTKNIRESDFAFRYGGEEFAILLPQTNHNKAVNLGDRLRDLVSQRDDFNKQVTISIGAADYPNQKHGIDEPDKLFNAADRLLYAAKSAGRNEIRSINGILPTKTTG